MKTLNWKRTDWNARNFIISIGQELIGQLSFNNIWAFSATYTDKHTKLKYTQKSFWDRDVLVTRDGNTIAEIHSGIFKETTLKLVTGERFIISTSLWEQEVYWKTEEGETIIKYQQAPMSSMEKGSISINNSLPTETEKLLTSSGLFIRQMARRRRVRTIAVMFPAIAAASKL